MSSKASSARKPPNISKDNFGFEDLDAFWKLSINQKAALKVATPKRQISLPLKSPSVPASTPATEVDFNYDDTASITEDEIEEENSFEETPFQNSKKADEGKINTTRSSISTSDIRRLSSTTLNSTLPLNDSFSTSRRSSIASVDSINPEIKEITPQVKRRGRPPKHPRPQSNTNNPKEKTPESNRKSEPSSDHNSREGAQAPIGFVDQFLSAADEPKSKSPPRNISLPAPSKQTSQPESRTPKSNLKKPKEAQALTSSSRQVSFTRSPDKEKNLIPPNTTEPQTSDDVYIGDEYSPPLDESPKLPLPANKKTPTNSKEKSKILTTTPATSLGISTPGSYDFTRGVRLDPDDEDDIYRGDDDESTDEEDMNETFVSETSFNESLKKKPKQYSESFEETDGNRRSSRVTKGQKFEYWKNERPVYEQGELKGLMIAVPTPAKPSNIKASAAKRSSKTQLFKVNESGLNSKDMKKRLRQDQVSQEERPPKLPSNVVYIDREDSEELKVWSDHIEKIEKRKCVTHRDKLVPISLQAGPKRPPGKDKVGQAGRMFEVSDIPNMSDWISGFVELPAGAIKDAEGTGDFVQLFFVADCQDLGLELAIADPSKTDWSYDAAQIQLLKKGDSFYIPPGNIYRLENHSSSKLAVLNWVIIRPISGPDIE